MKIKNVIFDLDGTVADTLPLCISAFKKSIEPLLEAELTTEEIIATFGPSEEGTIRHFVPNHEKEGVEAYLMHYEQLHHTCPSPFPGIVDLLEFLESKEIKLAMVTGKGIHSARLSLKYLKLEKYFDVLETGRAEGPDKINGILRVLDRLKANVSESIYIGDSPRDILDSKELGLPVVAAAWASTTDPAELQPLDPDWLFHSVEEFKDWFIKQFNGEKNRNWKQKGEV